VKLGRIFINRILLFWREGALPFFNGMSRRVVLDTLIGAVPHRIAPSLFLNGVIGDFGHAIKLQALNFIAISSFLPRQFQTDGHA